MGASWGSAALGHAHGDPEGWSIDSTVWRSLPLKWIRHVLWKGGHGTGAGKAEFRRETAF